MNKANECTCPSGNGSLVHPCPTHPAVEQAGGDERAAFELFVRKHCGMPAHIAVNWDAKFTNDAWEGWKARAALAQPSPDAPYADDIAADLERSDWTPEDALRWYAAGKHFDTVNGRTRIIDTGAVASNALKHLSLPYLEMKGDAELTELREAMAQPSPAQAEAERPEVVAYRTIGRHEKHQHPHYALNYYKQNAEDQAAHWRERGCEVSEDELMTVAQHERIVGELRAVIAQLRQHKNDYMDSGQETYRALQNEIREREAEIARLDGLVSGRTAERDAALANVDALAVQVLKLGGTISFAHHRTAQAGQVPQAWIDVQAERRRQVEAEGWTPEHDDLYCAAELPRAAAAYILNGANDEAPAIWPFSAKWWKPRDARSNYVRASALILAEIERLDRAAHGKEGV
ncbi:hypothetical protein ACV36C_03790 [Pseudomonas aeruginosa]